MRTLDQHRPQAVSIPESAQHMHPLGQPVRKRQTARLAAGGEQELGVADLAAIGQLHALALPVNYLNPCPWAELDPCGGERVSRCEGEFRGGSLALEIGLRERRPLIGSRRLRADQHDRTFMTVLA